MTRTKLVRLPKTWTEDADGVYSRLFGGILQAKVFRPDWRSETYTGYLVCGGRETEFTCHRTDISAQSYDDDSDAKAVRHIEKQMKAAIREWLK